MISCRVDLVPNSFFSICAISVPCEYLLGGLVSDFVLFIHKFIEGVVRSPYFTD